MTGFFKDQDSKWIEEMGTYKPFENTKEIYY